MTVLEPDDGANDVDRWNTTPVDLHVEPIQACFLYKKNHKGLDSVEAITETATKKKLSQDF